MRKTMLLTTGLAVIASAGALAAPRLPKPPKLPKVPNLPRIVKGTTQMAGDNGKTGITYTIGKAHQPINFTLLRSEYTVERVTLTDRYIIPKGNEKLLILHYTVHNPNKTEMLYNWGTLKFTAVDSQNVNHESTGAVVKEGTEKTYSENLKPAQKVEMYTAFVLPVEVSIPKIIVQRANDQPVLRLYFTKSDVKGFAAPFADSADTTGCTALTTVQAQGGTYYPCGKFDVKFVRGDYSTTPLGTFRPGRNQQWFVAHITAKNTLMRAQLLNWGTFITQAKTDDGEVTQPRGYTMIKTQRDEAHSQDLEPGQEYTARILIPIPVNSKVTELTLKEGNDGRKYTFKVE